MDESGKINGKLPVVNDVLAFAYSKVKLCQMNTLIEVILSYYAIGDLKEASDVLDELVGPSGQSPRLRSGPKSSDMATSIVHRIFAKYNDFQCLFLALDLNHIPCVDMIDQESVNMFLEQHQICRQLHEVQTEQAYVKSQLEIISKQLEILREQKKVISPRPQSRLERSQCGEQSQGQTAEVINVVSDSDSCLTMADIVRLKAPKGHTIDSDGFISKDKAILAEKSKKAKHQRQNQRPVVVGVKSPGKLKPAVNEVRIFATKFDPDETEADLKAYVSDLIGQDCVVEVEKIIVRTKRHSSFVITASKRYEQILLDPNSWEEGVLVRRFYGQLRSKIEH